MLKPSILLAALTLTSTGNLLAQPDRPTALPLPSVTLPPELDRVLRDYEREWQARSAAGLAALFVEDGFVLQAGKPPVRGRPGIMEAYRSAGGPLILRALAFSAGGTAGHVIGAYTYGAGAADVGKFILLLYREPGGPWRIVADMDNGNGPRPPS
jgi:ketosteroid isomerase-like protein